MTIEERIKELMQGDYDPIRADNLEESFANIDSRQIGVISDYLRVKDHASVGLYIETLTMLNWKRLARSQANADEERELADACTRCKGAGCSACDEDLRMENRQ